MTNGERAERERRFWNRCSVSFSNQGVGEPLNRWYVRRAEEFMREFPQRRLAEISTHTFNRSGLTVASPLDGV